MTRVDPDALEAFTGALLEHEGASEVVAEQVAESLVLADLRGHTSHGVLRIPQYATMIKEDALDPDATPSVDVKDAATATIDGRFAFGQVVGRKAVDLLAEKATEHGAATVGMRSATHLGRMGEWAERAASEGLVFTSFVNAQGGGQVVAPAGSADRRYSTNPITVSIPTFDALEFDIILDMATSQIAHGKIQEADAAGRPLPKEWAISPEGNPVTDPSDLSNLGNEGASGALRPLGGTVSGYKGTGLAVVTELLAGIAGVAPVAGQQRPTWFCNAAAFVAFDPLRFTTQEHIAEAVAAFVAHLRSAEHRSDVPIGAGAKGEHLLLPGEAEHLTTNERETEGIPLPGRAIDSLVSLAREHEITELLPDTLYARL